MLMWIFALSGFFFFFLRKKRRKVWSFRDFLLPLHPLNKDIGRSGRLAQLVESICLTSRGSAVRIRQRPHLQDKVQYVAALPQFSFNEQRALQKYVIISPDSRFAY